MLLGRRLREVRKNKGYTQTDLAKLLGVSKVTICGYERGNRVPSLGIFLQLLIIVSLIRLFTSISSFIPCFANERFVQ